MLPSLVWPPMKGSKRNKQQNRRRKSRSTGARPTKPTPASPAFTQAEEAFFAAGAALCEEHTKAHAELAVQPAPPVKWWRRAWLRIPSLAWE